MTVAYTSQPVGKTAHGSSTHLVPKNLADRIRLAERKLLGRFLY